MDTLVHLAARAGEVVSGDELIDAVWQGRVVYDAQIYKVISELRRAFRDHGNGEPSFAAGFHDEILNQVAKTTDLQIASRSSVLPYEGQQRSASEIGAELNVGAVLVGSVRYADDRVRIYMQLINAESDSQI